MRRELSDLPHLAKAQPLHHHQMAEGTKRFLQEPAAMGKSTATPPPGFMPVSGSMNQGYRKKEGLRWRYWYPSRAHAAEDARHHRAEMQRHGENFDRLLAGNHSADDLDRALFLHEQHHMHSHGAALAAQGERVSRQLGAFQIEGTTDDADDVHVGSQHESVNLHYWRYTPDDIEHQESVYVGERFKGHKLAEQKLQRMYVIHDDSPWRSHADDLGRPIVPPGYAAYHAPGDGAPIIASHEEVAQAATDFQRRRALDEVARSPLVKATATPPPGYTPIPDSQHQGYHKQVNGRWTHWYPSRHLATQARDHHLREAAGYAKDAREGGHLETGRKHQERMAERHRALAEMAVGALVGDDASGGPNTPPPGFKPVTYRAPTGEIVSDPHGLHHHVSSGDTAFWSPSPAAASASARHHEALAGHHADEAARAQPSRRRGELHTAHLVVSVEDYDPGVVHDGLTTADGTFIRNPFYDDNGFNEVDPVREYGAAGRRFLARHPNAKAEIGHDVSLGYGGVDHDFAQDLHRNLADGARRLAAPMLKARATPAFARALLALFGGLVRGSGDVVTMSKGLPDQLIAADPSTIDVLDRWDEDGYTCQVRKAAGGAQYLTIEGGNLPIPYHAIVSDTTAARRTAQEAIPKFKRGRSPREGVYRRPGARRQGPRTGYAVYH